MLYSKILANVKRTLVITEDIINIFVAIIFALVAILLGIKIFTQDFHASVEGIITLINDALLILIIKELLWTVIRFLGRHRFNIESYLFVGMIAGIRKILSLEANSTFHAKQLEMTQIWELSTMAGIILVLSLAYLLIKKADQYENTEKGSFEFQGEEKH